MNSKYVFISYKAEDFDRARPIKDHLEANGIPCWMAPMSIRGGLSYAQEIPPAIQECSAFVLFLTAKAQESKWVPREVDQAINCEKVILPFMPEQCPLRDDFSFYLTNVQRYEAFRAPEETLDRMTADIQQLLGIEPEEEVEEEEAPVQEETPPKPPKPKKAKPAKADKTKKKRLPWILGLSLMALILLILLLIPKKSNLGGLSFDLNDTSVLLTDVELTQADVDRFSEFKNLYIIRMENCTVSTTDLSPLATDGLMTLEMKNCGLTNDRLATVDFSGISDLSTLDVSGNPQLSSLAGVEVLADSLTELNISDTAIRDFQWLAAFAKLEVLCADRTGLSDTSLLEKMIYLRKLSLSGNGVVSLSGLKNTSKLSEVDLSHNKLSDVSVLSRNAECLKVLRLEDNTLAKLDCLSEATKLEKLYVDQNSLSDLNFLKGHTELRVLSASKNFITSISGLGIGEKMHYLNLSDNKLQTVDVGGLAFGSGEYVVVDLSKNRLTKLSLPTSCTYKMLNLLENSELDPESLQGVKGWNLYFDVPADVSVKGLEKLQFSSLCMVDCPLDRQVELEEGLTTERMMTREEALKEIAEKEAAEAA